jgi:predicted dehydrogenase
LPQIATAVIGAGAFGRNHVRVVSKSERAGLAAVVDPDRERAASAAGGLCPVYGSVEELIAAGGIDCAIVAAPTSLHAKLGCQLLEAGIDVLVEKPIAAEPGEARELIATAERNGRVLQVGHLERFNPAIAAVKKITRQPMFFEIHRLSVFSPRSLDVDVVLDLMIHDLDIVLDLTGEWPEEVRAAGLSILSGKVDIANVRLAFPGGCIANLTASRVSTERVRKLRMFQPRQYVTVDYQRQDAAVFRVSENRQIGFETLAVENDEPLRLEVESFFDAVISRRPTAVTGEQGLRALEAAFAILAKIEEHSRHVARQLETSA